MNRFVDGKFLHKIFQSEVVQYSFEKSVLRKSRGRSQQQVGRKAKPTHSGRESKDKLIQPKKLCDQGFVAGCVQQGLDIGGIVYGHFDHPAFSVGVGIDHFRGAAKRRVQLVDGAGYG